MNVHLAGPAPVRSGHAECQDPALRLRGEPSAVHDRDGDRADLPARGRRGHRRLPPAAQCQAGVPRIRGASVSTEGATDIEAAPEDGTVDPGKRPAISQRSGTPRSQSAVASSWSQPAAPNKQGSAVDEGWLNTITSTLAGALPFGGGGPAAPGPPVTPSEIPSANQMEVREVLYSDSADTACLPGNRQFTLEDVRGLYVC